MITTLTLNPCNDLTINIPSFVYGGMNRITSQIFDFAGKGFNVSKGVSRLGFNSTATGFLYNENGAATQKSLEKDGVNVDCVWLEGKIRTNTKLFDEKKRVITEINEPGIFTTTDSINAIIDKIATLCQQSSILVLSGSIPPGCCDIIYEQIINACTNKKCKIVLDAEGKKLLNGIKAQPYLIKPNLFELETAVSRELKTKQEIKTASREIIKKGVAIVAVSLGEQGLIISDEHQTLFSPAVKNIKVLGTVGAGDSMVAAFCAAIKKNESLEMLCKMGVAAATSCVVQEGTSLVTKAGLEQMLERVEVIKI